MLYDTMNKDTIKELLKDQKDILSEAAKKDEDLYKHARCPNCCCTSCTKKFPIPKIITGPDGYPTVVDSPFNQKLPIMQGWALCTTCKTEFDPRTGIILKPGSDGTIAAPKLLTGNIETLSNFGEET